MCQERPSVALAVKKRHEEDTENNNLFREKRLIVRKNLNYGIFGQEWSFANTTSYLRRNHRSLISQETTTLESLEFSIFHKSRFPVAF